MTKRKFTLAILASLLLHLLLLEVFTKPVKNTIAVTFVKTKIKLDLPVQKKPSPQKTASGNHTAAQTSSVTASKPSKDETPYSKLLPTPAYNVAGVFADSSDADSNQIKGEKLAPEAQMPADRWSSTLLLPLRWRKFKDEVHAVARLAIDENNKLWIRYLNGDPMLRAILYEGFKSKDFEPYIRQVMRAQNKKEFLVKLKFLPETGRSKSINDEAVVFEDGIEITKLMPPPMRSFQGMPIEDEHSRKAKKREELEIAKFMESPAYTHSLTDYAL